MKSPKSIVLLLCLVLVAGLLWWKRFHNPEAEGEEPAQSQRTPPPGLQSWKFKTEQHWVIDEIGRDIVEMVLYAKDANAPAGGALELTSKISPGPGEEFSLSAKTESGAVSEKLPLKHHLWAGENYFPWAKAALDKWKIVRPDQKTPANAGLLQRLASAQSRVLVTESQRVSKDLSQHPLDAELHEEAALILGSFALREAAGHFSDTRPTLSRMTAHLALARALREKQELCGQVAEAIQLCLVNREAEALEKIAQFPPELSSWATALKMRCTGDWRMLPKPETAGFLEQMEYARALVHSIGINALRTFLEKGNAPELAEWGRIAMERDFSVEEGHIFAKESMGVELQDLAEAWKAWSGKELSEDELVQVANDPATRCVVKAGDGKQRLEALSWGDFAAFHQRHICHSIQRNVHFLREMWGVPDLARQFEDAVDSKLSALRLYPFVRKRCASASGPYARAMKDVLELCSKQPELVTAANWTCVRERTNFGNQNSQVPDPLAWFAPLLPSGTAFDFANRHYEFHELYKADVTFWEKLQDIAPYDFDVIGAVRWKKVGTNPTLQQMREGFAKISDYHVTAMREIADLCKADPKEHLTLMRRAAELRPDLYLRLAGYLLEKKMPDEAAFAYQAAFERATDRVAMANASAWIVNYYFDHGRQEDALKIATEAAEVYSHGGLETMARLMERMNKLEDAEKHFGSILERYNDAGALIAFYLRHKDANPEFAERIRKSTAAVFPDGMKKVAIGDFSAAPTDGVIVNSTNQNTNRAGLKRGDIFVALDGYRVQSLEQYMLVRGLTDDPKLNLIVWKGSKYAEVSVSLEKRRFNSDISTYRAEGR